MLPDNFEDAQTHWTAFSKKGNFILPQKFECHLYQTCIDCQANLNGVYIGQVSIAREI
jgi:hypothetical protein